jgi:maltooligosyltrehalose trehalohydrolase
VLTGEHDGYYADYGMLSQLATALTAGFVYQGEYSPHRQHSYGRPPNGLLGRHFHVFNQNHDQIGNRALGDRLGESVSDGALKIAAALTLLSPFVPMLFMGEEWGATTAFQYFTDHGEPQLADAVRQGRRREFEAFGWDPNRIPDPQAESTVLASTLDWTELEQDRQRAMLEWYRSLVDLRRQTPSLLDDDLRGVRVDYSEALRWLLLDRGSHLALVNFSNASLELPLELTGGVDSPPKLLLTSVEDLKWTDSAVVLPPQSVIVVEKGR